MNRRQLMDDVMDVIRQGLAVTVPSPCVGGALNPEWLRARAANITAALFGEFVINPRPDAEARPDPTLDDSRIT